MTVLAQMCGSTQPDMDGAREIDRHVLRDTRAMMPELCHTERRCAERCGCRRAVAQAAWHLRIVTCEGDGAGRCAIINARPLASSIFNPRRAASLIRQLRLHNAAMRSAA